MFHVTDYCHSQHIKTDAGYYCLHDEQVQKCLHGVILLLASLAFCIIIVKTMMLMGQVYSTENVFCCLLYIFYLKQFLHSKCMVIYT
jgi:hypothetical protein